MKIFNHPLFLLCFLPWIVLVPQVDAGTSPITTATFDPRTNSFFRKNPLRMRVNRVFQDLIHNVFESLDDESFDTFFDRKPQALPLVIRLFNGMKRLDYFNMIRRNNLTPSQMAQLQDQTSKLKIYCMEDVDWIESQFPESLKELKGRFVEAWKVVDGFIQTFFLDESFSLKACTRLKEIIKILSNGRPLFIDLITYLNEIMEIIQASNSSS
jgi:hypothetical protein